MSGTGRGIGAFALLALSFGAAGCATSGEWNRLEGRAIDLDDRVCALEDAVAALRAGYAAHYADASNVVERVYSDMNRVRFAQRAMANTLRFAAGGDGKGGR